MKFAIIENEFGDIGIDENIIVENSEESIIEVMNGCICCTVRGRPHGVVGQNVR